jgi:hypothetical protein
MTPHSGVYKHACQSKSEYDEECWDEFDYLFVCGADVEVVLDVCNIRLGIDKQA